MNFFKSEESFIKPGFYIKPAFRWDIEHKSKKHIGWRGPFKSRQEAEEQLTHGFDYVSGMPPKIVWRITRPLSTETACLFRFAAISISSVAALISSIWITVRSVISFGLTDSWNLTLLTTILIFLITFIVSMKSDPVSGNLISGIVMFLSMGVAAVSIGWIIVRSIVTLGFTEPWNLIFLVALLTFIPLATAADND